MHHSSAKLLTFAIDRQRFAIGADFIQEVVRAVRLAQIPDAPRIVEGLIDLRGTVVPVLDIRARFRLPRKALAPPDHIVIAQARGRTVGLRVDRALGVIDVSDADIAAIDGLTPAGDLISGVAKLPDGLLFIHDLATFLSEAEAQSLDELVAEGRPS